MIEDTLQIDRLASFSDRALDWFMSILPDLVGALAVAVIGWWLIGIFTRRLHAWFQTVDFDEALETFLESLIGISLKIVLIVVVISMLGVQTSTFVAMLGAMSLAVGLALQGSLANFAGGVLILIFKPFKVGDLIDSGGFKGVVKEIQIFNTILQSPNKETIVLPNGELSNNPLINVTGSHDMNAEFTFGIGYDDDIDQAKEIIREIIVSDERIMDEQGYKLGVRELADSAVNIYVRVTVHPDNYWDVLFDTTEGVKKAFDAAGISIPYPQMDIHMSKD